MKGLPYVVLCMSLYCCMHAMQNKAEELLRHVHSEPNGNKILQIYMSAHNLHEIAELELHLANAARDRGLSMQAMTIKHPQMIRQYVFSTKEVMQ